MEKLESEFNERGYLKDILPAGMANEQQLSGHNWLLRGLLELYLWRGDAKIRRWAQAIVENLYLPVKVICRLPLDPDCRSFDGAPGPLYCGEICQRLVPFHGYRLRIHVPGRAEPIL